VVGKGLPRRRSFALRIAAMPGMAHDPVGSGGAVPLFEEGVRKEG
jgi:hypothetical protein